jgi:hypothetical protein
MKFSIIALLLATTPEMVFSKRMGAVDTAHHKTIDVLHQNSAATLDEEPRFSLLRLLRFLSGGDDDDDDDDGDGDGDGDDDGDGDGDDDDDDGDDDDDDGDDDDDDDDGDDSKR